MASDTGIHMRGEVRRISGRPERGQELAEDHDLAIIAGERNPASSSRTSFALADSIACRDGRPMGFG